MTGRPPFASPPRADAGVARLILIAGLAVALLGAGAVWWFVLRDDAPPPAALGDCAPPSGGEAPSSADGTWQAQPGNLEDAFVGYRMEERFGGETVTKTAVGRTGDVDGTLVIAGDTVTDTTIVARLGSLTSDRTARDTALRTKGLETDLFPEARFTLTEPIVLAAEPTLQTPLEATAPGTLEIHGEEREVQVQVTACWTGPTVKLSGSVPIVLADYGIEPIETPIVDIADNGEMEFELIFTPA